MWGIVRCAPHVRCASVRSEVMARQYLAKLGAESYWDMCRNYRADTDL